MGIFDGINGGQAGLSEEYKTAYDHAQNQLQHMNIQAQMERYKAAQQSILGQGAYNPVKPFNPNECEAYVMPMSQLITLWQAKYGDQWVATFGDEFWEDAFQRLLRANKLEEARGGWVRIKEDA